jgi:hypothetical protein
MHARSLISSTPLVPSPLPSNEISLERKNEDLRASLTRGSHGRPELQPQQSSSSSHSEAQQSQLEATETKLAFLYQKFVYVSHRCRLLDRTCRALLDASSLNTEQAVRAVGALADRQPPMSDDLGFGGAALSPYMGQGHVRDARGDFADSGGSVAAKSSPLLRLPNLDNDGSSYQSVVTRSPLRRKEELPDARVFLRMLAQQQQQQGQSQ